MLKRLLLWFGATVVIVCVVLLIWQPDTLKTQLLNAIAKDVSRSTSYELSIARVSGNIFTGVTLENVHVLSKADHSELLQAKAIRIGISWLALLHRKIQVRSLDWVEPAFRYDIDSLKNTPSSLPKTREPFPLTYSIRRLTIENGHVTVVNSGLASSKDIQISDIAMDAHVSTQHLDVHQLAWRLDRGRGSAQGRFTFSSQLSGDMEIQTHDMALDRFLAFTGAMPSPPALPFSGEWAVHIASGSTAARMKGTLADGPIELTGLYTRSEIERAHVTWQKPGLGSLSFGMAHGAGRFNIAVSSGNFKATVEGKTNWSKRSVEGHAALTEFLWQKTKVKNADLQFSFNPHEQHVAIKTDEVQFHRDQNPFDLASSQSEVRGLSPHWRVDSQMKFRNGATADIAGIVSKHPDSWELTWEKLAIAFPSAGTWTADQVGTLSRSAEGRLALAHVSLLNGNQSIQIPEATMNRQRTRLALEIKNLDPSPWFKLFVPGTSLTSASLNASLQVHGTGDHLLVDGFVNGKAKSLDIGAIGLNAKELDVDVRAADGKIEVKKFTAKTKKGEITITGGAAWPELDYSLHARDLVLNTTKIIKATGDLDIHLTGTADEPVLTGHLTMKEAAYVASTKAPKNKPTATADAAPASANSLLWRHSAIDMDTHWTRNVWYREGVTNIETQGDLRIQKPKDKTTLVLTGTIRSVRGTYNYFGRDFNIDSGQIQFAGTPEMNPLLNIEASYSGDPTTTIYLDITGSGDKPVLKVRSNPPLPQQDIISVIVFGQPLNELRSRTGTQTTNQQMMQAAGGVLGSYVTKELRQTGIAELNVDMLNVQATPQGSQLTLGRYLTRRLFISYGQAIRGSAEKSVTADYFLTDKWTLQGASDSTQGNYMDFLFRYPLNRSSLSNSPPLPISPFRNTLDIPNPQQVGYSH